MVGHKSFQFDSGYLFSGFGRCKSGHLAAEPLITWGCNGPLRGPSVWKKLQLLRRSFSQPAVYWPSRHTPRRGGTLHRQFRYKSVGWLDNPKNDATLMAETLRWLGLALVGDVPARSRQIRCRPRGGAENSATCCSAPMSGCFSYAGARRGGAGREYSRAGVTKTDDECNAKFAARQQAGAASRTWRRRAPSSTS